MKKKNLKKSKGSEKGCLMIYPSKSVQQSISKLAKKNIPKSELHEFGYEIDSHVTLLYGFEPDFEFNQLIRYIAGVNNFSINLKDIKVFENKEEGFDAVVIAVEDNVVLKTLNSIIKRKFNIKSKFPKYQPHMTLAYVKHGLGKKYEGLRLRKKVMLKDWIYSICAQDKYIFDNRKCVWNLYKE